jgi:heme-degrading monooxygenase HmoA
MENQMTSIAAQDHPRPMFVFMEKITPIQGRADDVLAISIRSAESLKEQPGIMQSMVTKAAKKGGEIVSISVWASKSDFQNFMKSDQTAALLKSDDMRNIKAWMSDYENLMTDMVDIWHS